MLTVKQIIRETPAAIMKQSFNVSVKTIQANLYLDVNPEIENIYNEYILKTKRPGRNHRTHNNIIRVYHRDKVWVRCDCDYFKYNCEVSLKLAGSTDILYSNGSMPRIKNPQLRKRACIHLVSCFMYLQRQNAFGR